MSGFELAEECFTYGVPLDAIRQGNDGVFYVVVAGRGVVPLTSKSRPQLALDKLFLEPVEDIYAIKNSRLLGGL